MHRGWQRSALFITTIPALLLSCTTAALAAGTPAGTLIECVSTASYSNEAGDPQPQVSSNTVVLTVARKPGASVSPPTHSITSHPGEAVRMPLEVRNLGNAQDVFRLRAATPDGWEATIYLDENGDGTLQSTEVEVLASTPPLLPDSLLKVIMEVQVPSDAPDGVEAQVVVTALEEDSSNALASATYAVLPLVTTPEITIAANPAKPNLGQPFTLTMQLEPARQDTLTLRSLAPDGTEAEHQVTTDSQGLASLTITPTVSGTWVYSAEWGGASQAEPASVNLALKCQGPVYDVSGLDMISIPLDLVDNSPGGMFGSGSPVALARWLPAKLRYAVYDPFAQVPSADTLEELIPGEGYWIGTGSTRRLEPVGRLVNQKQPYRIDLTPGWQQIGSPYLTTTDWSATRVLYNGNSYTLAEARQQQIMLEYAWTFIKLPDAWGYALIHPTLEGAWKTLEPWKGYWVYLAKPATLELAAPAGISQKSMAMEMAMAEAEDEDLFETERRRRRRGEGFPFPVQPGQPDQPEYPGGYEQPAPDENNWHITLKASCGEVMDAANYLGVTTDRTLSGIANPPRSSGYVDLYFPRAEQAQGEGPFASDFRSDFTGTRSWVFEVASTYPGRDHLLEWSGLQRAPGNLQFWLLDHATGQTVDLRAAGAHPFTTNAVDEPVRFTLTVTGG